jgi:hypothetical protein
MKSGHLVYGLALAGIVPLSTLSASGVGAAITHHHPPRPSHPKLVQWFKAGGEKEVTQTLKGLSTDSTAVSTDAITAGNGSTNGDFSAVQTDCQTLSDDAQASLDLPPIPLPSLNQLWRAYLSGLGEVGSTCVNAINDGSTLGLSAGTSLLDAGDQQLVRFDTALGNDLGVGG